MVSIYIEIILGHRQSCSHGHNIFSLIEGKTIPEQALTGPEDSRRLRLSDFQKIGKLTTFV
jgi:hypothetical protein